MVEKQINNLEWIEKSNIDTWTLLSELSEDISKSFWIKAETAEKLTRLKTESWLDGLKTEIESSDLSREEKDKLNNLWDKQLERLFFTITWAKEIIKSASENKLDVLKKEIDNESFSPSKSWIQDRLPANIVKRISEPKHIWDNLIWALVWIWNIWESLVIATFNLWKWIIQTPYHLYLLITRQAEIDSLKKV